MTRTLGAATQDLLAMERNLQVTAWVGFILGYERLPAASGYTQGEGKIVLHVVSLRSAIL